MSLTLELDYCNKVEVWSKFGSFIGSVDLLKGLTNVRHVTLCALITCRHSNSVYPTCTLHPFVARRRGAA